MSKVARAEKYLDLPDVTERYGVSRTTIYRWMKKEEFPTAVIISGRRYFSELSLSRWEATRGAPDPDLPGRAVGLQIVSSVITDYDQLVEALRKRRNDIGIPSIELDARSGMQEGYTSKLENYGRPQGRGMGPETFPLWLGALKCGVILVDLPRRPRSEGNIKAS